MQAINRDQNASKLLSTAMTQRFKFLIINPIAGISAHYRDYAVANRGYELGA